MKNQTETPFDEARRAASQVELGYKTWSDISLQSRIKKIRKLRRAVSKNARRIAETISRECHRPVIEALSQEVLPVLEMAKYCEKKFPKWLSQRRLPYRRPGFWQKKNSLFYEPIGPVAIFSPQNFPFSLGMMTLIYAILPGNTVVLKPSEKSLLVPSLIEEILREAGLLTANAVTVLRGDARIGQWLIRHHKVKKLFFFGSRKSGEDVAKLCGEYSKPFVLETGGGCTALVTADADIEQAATGLAWSSFYSHGQSCVSTEKIFIDERIADKFIHIFKEKVMNFQIEMISDESESSCDSFNASRLNELIEDAKEQGAEVFRASRFPSEEKVGFFRFTAIFGTTNSMRVFKEEIFGPIVAVQTVPNLKATISGMTNNHSPMGVSIWSRNSKQAYQIAKKIPAGMIWINDSSYGLPHLPWGGSEDAARGNLFSEFSIQQVTRLKWVSQHPARFSRKRFWWNPYSMWKKKLMIKIAEHFF